MTVIISFFNNKPLQATKLSRTVWHNFFLLAYHNLTQSEPDSTPTPQLSGNELIVNTCINKLTDKTIIKAFQSL